MSETNSYEHGIVITSDFKMKYLGEMPENVQKQLKEYIEMLKVKYRLDVTPKDNE